MPTIDVHIGDGRPAAGAVAALARRVERLGGGDPDSITRRVGEVATDFERRGRELAAGGSQFRVVQTLPFPGCRVRVTASYSPGGGSLWARLRSAFRG